jgi:hypothetical protein
MCPSDSDPVQLDLFLVRLPPCGRRGCPRQAIVEPGPSGTRVRCEICNCSAPHPAEQPRSADALAAILNTFMESQTKFFQFRHEPESLPDSPAKLGDQGAPKSS